MQPRNTLSTALFALIFFLMSCAGISPYPLGEPIRVGTSGDYSPFSRRDAETGDYTGYDIEVALRFARDTGHRVEFVEFEWPQLLEDFAADRFDVAMSGVTVRPDRSLAGRFSLPVAQSGAVALVRRGDAGNGLAALDRPGSVIAVNRGGHLERVARARFRAATIRAITPNDAVPEELLAGRAHAIVTDTLEAPHWIAAAASEAALVALGPFTQDDKAYLVRPDRVELVRAFDAWLLERERDGTLARLRAEHFGPGDWTPTAAVDRALEAAGRERLALMPLVAESKRRSGSPVEDREREQRVLEAALRGVERAAAERGVPPPEAATVTRFFERQIDDAKRVQHQVLSKDPDPATPRADLVDDIRPALIRIGDRIAALLVEQSAPTGER